METTLVTGVGGQVGGVGTKIVDYLRQRGQPVRAMVRSSDRRFDDLVRQGVEVVVGDLTNLADVQRALQGIRRVYLGLSVSPQYLEATANLAVVARHQGLEALVNMSQMTVSGMSVSQTTDSPQHKLHWLSEQVLNWSGLPVVHVRPTVFLENPLFLDLAGESIRTGRQLRLPFGNGRTAPIATSDVARVVGEILLDPSKHIGSIYELTGPRSANMHEIAGEYSRALGRDITYQDVPIDAWLRQLATLGLPLHVESHIRTMAQMHRDNQYDRFSSEVEKLTGTPALSVTDWVREHREVFEGNRLRIEDTPSSRR